jgi:hypothetical protein
VGRDLIQIYNDAALSIVRAKHPASFAAPARQAWSDVWDVIGPLAECVIGTGEPVLGEDRPLLPDRGGPREAAYFTFCYSALRDESGAVAGMLVTAIETTAKMRADAARREGETRQAFLLKLSDALRPLTDPIEIQSTAARVLGEHIGANRVLYADIVDGKEAVINRDFVSGVASIAGRYPTEAFGSEPAARLRRGETLVSHDVATEPWLSGANRKAFEAINVASFMGVSLVK